MKESDTGRRPAEVYEQLFVPALFRQWGKVVTEAAAIGLGHRVLDVACGTGVLARAVAERVGPEGMVVGLDASEEMLAVARRSCAGIEWHKGQAEAIPFTDESFDAVVSQFGLMFFEDRVVALREMKRVLRRGGRMAVAVWDALDHCPGYAALAKSLDQLFGEPVVHAFRSPFVLGDPGQLLSLCAAAGIRNPSTMRHNGLVRFASIESLVSTERTCAWTLGALLDDAQFDRLLSAARQFLRPFVETDGSVVFNISALLFAADKE